MNPIESIDYNQIIENEWKNIKKLGAPNVLLLLRFEELLAKKSVSQSVQDLIFIHGTVDSL